MFGGLLQPSHLILLLIIMLVVLGPKKLPEAGRAIGHGLKEFKDSIGGDQDHENDAAEKLDPAKKLDPAPAASAAHTETAHVNTPTDAPAGTAAKTL